MLSIPEGNRFPAAAETVIYPKINSCLTITCVSAGNVFAGGHAVLIAEPGQYNVDEIVRFVRVTTAPAARTHLFLIGDTGTWDENLGAGISAVHADLAAIAAQFGCGHTIVDVLPYTNNGSLSVDVRFSPVGYWQVLRRTGGIHLTGTW